MTAPPVLDPFEQYRRRFGRPKAEEDPFEAYRQKYGTGKKAVAKAVFGPVEGSEHRQGYFVGDRVPDTKIESTIESGEDPGKPFRPRSAALETADDWGRQIKQGIVGAAEGAAALPADLAVELPRSLLRTGKFVKDVLVDAEPVEEAVRKANPLAEEAGEVLGAVHHGVRSVGDRLIDQPMTEAERRARNTVGPLIGQAAAAGAVGAVKRGMAAKAAASKNAELLADLERMDEAAAIGTKRGKIEAARDRAGYEHEVNERAGQGFGAMNRKAQVLNEEPNTISRLARAHDERVAEAHTPRELTATEREAQMFPEARRMIERPFHPRNPFPRRRPETPPAEAVPVEPPKVEAPTERAQPAKSEAPKERASATVDPGTLYSGIDPKFLKNRAVASAALGATGYGLSQSDNPELEATGKGMMALAALHAVGAKRFARLGRSVGRPVFDILKNSPTGRKIIDAINPEALLAPEVKTAIRQYEKDVAFTSARAKELGGKARALGPQADRKVSDVIEGEAFESSHLSPEMTEKVLAVAAEITDEFTRIGRAKVRSGLLSSEAVAKREGKYLPRKYAAHEAEDVSQGLPSGTSAKKRIGAEHMREDLSPEVRNQLGEIREASYRTEKGIEKSGKDLAAARLFQTLRNSPDALHPEWVQAADAVKAARASGNAEQILLAERNLRSISRAGGDWVTLPDTRGLGPLRGAVVRREVANSINGLPEIGGAGGALLRYWKKVHTVYNPGTHLGNFFSNVSLAHLAGLNAWEQPVALAKAARELRVYGPHARALAEAGVLDANIATVTGEGAALVGKNAKTRLRELATTTRPETASRLAEQGVTGMGKVERGARKIDQKVSRLYNNEDNVFRVALYRKAVLRKEQGGLGMQPKDAAEYVREKLINFRTRSPLLNWTRNTVSPFVLFPAKALPLVASQIVEHPWRWVTLAATWGALDQYSQSKVGRIPDEDLSDRDQRSKVGYLMPGLTQLPFQNAEGDNYALDVSRYTPLNAVTTGGVPGSTGSAISSKVPAVVQPSGPLVDIMARLALNTDPFTGEKFIRPGDDARDIAQKATVGKMGPGTFQPGALAGLALPSAASFHIPRVATDLKNADPNAARVDALGVLGMRPRVVRPGQEAKSRAYRYRVEQEDIREQMRRDLRKAKTTEAKVAIFERAREKQRKLVRRYQSDPAMAER